MKLTKIKRGADLSVPTGGTMKSPPTCDTEHVGPIPGMSSDDPDYEVMRKRLSRLKNTNPALYKRLTNWD